MTVKITNAGRIGITTTVPVEVLLAAGLVPVDLNNAFVASANPVAMVEEAENAGFPRNCCAWIKGVYSACRRSDLKLVLGVVRGDCSSTGALLEILRSEGVKTLEFAYPVERRPRAVEAAIRELCSRLGTDMAAAEGWRLRLEPIRAMLAEVAELAHRGIVRSGEAHLWLVSASDFCSDPEDYGRRLSDFLAVARSRPLPSPALPVALAGVPPIVNDLFGFLESAGVRIVYNEIPAEFSMLRARKLPLGEMYAAYTYPYDHEYRMSRLREEVAASGAQGMILYLQSFCHRQIGARLIREGLGRPVLALECDRPGTLDAAARTRVEGFLEMLRNREAKS